MAKKNGKRRRWAADIMGLLIRAGCTASVAELRQALGGGRRPSPYQPVAQAVRRLRLAGLVRRADGRRGPGLAATYALTAKGKKAAENQ